MNLRQPLHCPEVEPVASTPQRRFFVRMTSSLGSLAAVVCLIPVPPVSAQWANQVSVEGRVTATNNSSTTSGTPGRADIYSLLRPALALQGRGPNFALSVGAAVDLITYSRGSQPDKALPQFNGELKSELAQKLFYLDASADVHQTALDAYGLGTDAVPTSNRRTISSYRVSPYLFYEFTPRLSVLARHDESHTRQSDGVSPDLKSHYSIARLAGKPVPFGFVIEVSRLENEFSGATSSELKISQAKAGVSMSVFDEVIVGATAGTERTRLLLSDENDTSFGLNLRWVPTPRTELYGNLEHRFFGKGGELRFSHRTPFTVFSMRADREPITATSSLGVVGAGASVSAALDAILARSTPDPIQRAVQVQNLIASRGLQTTFPSAVDIVASYPQLQTRVTASWVYLGPRATTSLSAYRLTLRQLSRAGAIAAPIAVSDSQQQGASLEVNYRLQRETSVNGSLRWSEIDGLNASAGQHTRERSVRFSLVQNLSSRTGMTAGAQYTEFDSNTTIVQSQSPTLIFIGLTHRF